MTKVASSSSNDFDFETPTTDIEEPANKRQRATIRLLAIVVVVLSVIILVGAFLAFAPYSPFHISTSSDSEAAVPNSYDFEDLTHEENLVVYPFVKARVILPESLDTFGRDEKLHGWQLEDILYWIKESIGNENMRAPYTGIPDYATISCENTHETLKKYAKFSLVDDENVPSPDDIRDALKDAVGGNESFATTDDITILQTIVIANLMFGFGE